MMYRCPWCDGTGIDEIAVKLKEEAESDIDRDFWGKHDGCPVCNGNGNFSHDDWLRVRKHLNDTPEPI